VRTSPPAPPCEGQELWANSGTSVSNFCFLHSQDKAYMVARILTRSVYAIIELRAHTFYNPKMSLSLPSAFAEVSLVRLRPHVASHIVTWFSGFAYSNLVLKIGF